MLKRRPTKVKYVLRRIELRNKQNQPIVGKRKFYLEDFAKSMNTAEESLQVYEETQKTWCSKIC